MKLKQKTKRLFSILLSCVLLLGMLPTTVFAEEPTKSTNSVTMKKSEYNDKNIEINFNINKTADDDVVIDVGNEVTALLSENVGVFMPANQFNVTVHIKNNSPNTYIYKTGGLELGSKQAKDSPTLTNFIGYDDNKIDLFSIGSIQYNHPAMIELFGQKLYPSDYQKAIGMYDLLQKKGYEGDSALSDYFLDYYKDKYSDETLTWEKFMQNPYKDTEKNPYRDQMIADFRTPGVNNLFDNVSDEDLKKVQNTKLDDFTVVTETHDDGTHEVQFKWPEAQLAKMSYNFFYEDLFTITFGEEKPDTNDGMRTRGVGDYIEPDSDAYTKADGYLNSQIGELENGEEGTFNMTMTLEGWGTGNMYPLYQFGHLFDLILNFEPKTIDIEVEKKWKDSNNQDGIRPEEITVQLMADGKVEDGETLVLSSDNQWKGKFENLVEYKKGQKIVYSVDEVKANGYDTSVKGNVEDGFVITNSHTPKKVNVSVKKNWTDNNNQDGIRPEAITIQLMADGKAVDGKTLVLNGDNQWTGKFENLPKYHNGQKIVYTVDEIKVDGYDTSISGNVEDGFVITNSHTPKCTIEPTEPSKPSKSIEVTPSVKSDSPQTGDNFNLFLWVALLFVSCSGLITHIVLKKRGETK